MMESRRSHIRIDRQACGRMATLAVLAAISLSAVFCPSVAAGEASADGGAGAPHRVCMTASERTAWQMRVLQTQMMIGALQCRGRHAAGQREGYNRFVRRYRPVLKTQAAIFVVFVRHWAEGPRSRRVDREVTRIANQLSLAAGKDPDFCERIAAFGAALNADEPPALGALFTLMPLTLAPPLRVCPEGGGARIAED